MWYMAWFRSGNGEILKEKIIFVIDIITVH